MSRSASKASQWSRRDRLSPDVAKAEGYIPIAGPYRPDSEVVLLTMALLELGGSDVRLVIEESAERNDFTGISIYRHAKEVKQ